MIRRIRQRHRPWLLFVLLAGLFFAFASNPFTQTVFLFAAAVTVIAFGWTVVARPRHVHYEVSPDRVTAGEPVHASIHITASWPPLPWLQVTDGSPVWPRAPRYLTSLGPRRRATCSEPLRPGKRGIYPLGPVTVAWGDPFGLFETQATLQPPPAALVVYPRVVTLLHLPLPLPQPFGVRRPRPEAFEDLTSPSDQRPYRAGDSLRRVNWKTTARVGELYTREYDYTASADVHIVLDLAAASFDRAVTGVANDEPAAELAAAVAEYGLRSGFGVSLTTYGPDRRHVPLRHGRQQLQPFLDLLAAAAATATIPPADVVRLEQQQFGAGAVAVIISPDTSPEFAQALIELRQQRRLRMLVLTVRPEGSRADERWRQRLSLHGIRCLSVSGPEELNEGGAWQWSGSGLS